MFKKMKFGAKYRKLGSNPPAPKRFNEETGEWESTKPPPPPPPPPPPKYILKED